MNKICFRLYAHPLHKSEKLSVEYSNYEKKVLCEKEFKQAKQQLVEAKSVLQLDELKCRKRVLRRLGYCTNADVIELKGRVACELSRYDLMHAINSFINALLLISYLTEYFISAVRMSCC